jgi:hypothetical protein
MAVCGPTGHDESTTTVADTHTGKVVGKPYWGEPDVRFDEGAEGITDTWVSTETLHGYSEVTTRHWRHNSPDGRYARRLYSPSAAL